MAKTEVVSMTEDELFRGVNRMLRQARRIALSPERVQLIDDMVGVIRRAQQCGGEADAATMVMLRELHAEAHKLLDRMTTRWDDLIIRLVNRGRANRGMARQGQAG
jgi:hypothetical protein